MIDGGTLRTFAAAGRYHQGPGALDLVPEKALALGARPAIVGDADVARLFGERLAAGFASLGVVAPLLVLDGDITHVAIAQLSEVAKAGRADVIVGIGGGKSLDAGKGVARALDVPFVSVPTIASTDAPASAGLAIYDDNHVLAEIQQMKRNPDCVIVDTAVIARAPVRFLRAGIGDAIAKKFEAEACAAADGRTKHRTRPSASGLAIADACYRLIRVHAEGALRAAERGEPDEDFEALVEATVLLSALGFENGGLSMAHAVTRGLMQTRIV
jgi:glycerol dehydrogenase